MENTNDVNQHYKDIPVNTAQDMKDYFNSLSEEQLKLPIIISSYELERFMKLKKITVFNSDFYSTEDGALPEARLKADYENSEHQEDQDYLKECLKPENKMWLAGTTFLEICNFEEKVKIDTKSN